MLELTYKTWKPFVSDETTKYQRFVMVWKQITEWRYNALTQFLPAHEKWSPYGY